MSRYIDADALEDKAKQYSLYKLQKALYEMVDALSIGIEPKRGEWKRMKFTDCGLPVDKCSICGHYINGDVEVRNFCPNCGAKMK